jgi:hypothetical protein
MSKPNVVIVAVEHLDEDHVRLTLERRQHTNSSREYRRDLIVTLERDPKSHGQGIRSFKIEADWLGTNDLRLIPLDFLAGKYLGTHRHMAWRFPEPIQEELREAGDDDPRVRTPSD